MKPSLVSSKAPERVVIGRTALQQLSDNPDFMKGVDRELGISGMFMSNMAGIESAIQKDSLVKHYESTTTEGLMQGLTGFLEIKNVKLDGPNFVRDTLLPAYGSDLSSLHAMSRAILAQMRKIKAASDKQAVGKPRYGNA